MFPYRSSLTGYRGYAGRPRRGLQTPAKSTTQWIEKVRVRAKMFARLREVETDTRQTCRERTIHRRLAPKCWTAIGAKQAWLNVPIGRGEIRHDFR